MDVRFGTEQTGLDVAQTILSRQPVAEIVFMTQVEYDTITREAYRVDAKGLLIKDGQMTQPIEAINTAHENKDYYLLKIAERLVNMAIQGDFRRKANWTHGNMKYVCV